MNKFLEVVDEKKQKILSVQKLVREAFLLPESDRDSLESKAEKMGLSKTDLIRIGLKMVHAADESDIYTASYAMFRKSSGRRRGS